MVKRSTYKILAFQNLSQYTVSVSFHNYFNCIYMIDNGEKDLILKPGSEIRYRAFHHGIRVKILCLQPTTTKNGKERTIRKALTKRALFEDTKFVILEDGTLRKDEVSLEEFTDACFIKMEKHLRLIRFLNKCQDSYHVTFHGTIFNKNLRCPRTKTTYPILMSNGLDKIYYNKIYVKIYVKDKLKHAQLFNLNQDIVLEEDGEVTVKPMELDYQSLRRLLYYHFHVKCGTYEELSKLDDFYDVLNINEQKYNVTAKLVTKKYAKKFKKIEKKKTKYTEEEIQIAHDTLVDDQRRRGYNNYLDYQNEELLMNAKGWLKKKFFAWAWNRRRWFSFCRSEPPTFDCKTTCQRYLCLAFTLIFFMGMFVCVSSTKGFRFRPISLAILTYGFTFAWYFGIRRVMNDHFHWKNWLKMSFAGAISGVLVGVCYHFSLKSIQQSYPDNTWLQQAVSSSVIGITMSFFMSILSDWSDAMDNIEETVWSILKRAVICAFVGGFAGFTLGIISDQIFKLKANQVLDDIVLDSFIERVRAFLKFIFSRTNAWICFQCLSRHALTKGCPFLCLSAEKMIRYQGDKVQKLEVLLEESIPTVSKKVEKAV